MRPTEILKEEHRIIEKVLDAINNEVARLREGGAFIPAFFETAVDFIRNFADGAHHAKEEDQLFPLLERLGVPKEEGPVGCMLKEHEQGRQYVRNIVAALEQAVAGQTEAAAQAATENAAGYAALLRDHIYKEDNILYPLGDSLMKQEDQAELTTVFDRIEREYAAAGHAEKYRRIADELSKPQYQK